MICVNDTLGLAYFPIPKVASTALRASFRGRHATEVPPGYETVAVIRDWRHRLVSALFSVLRSFAPLDQRIEQYMQGDIDSHIRPQVRFLPPKVDRLIRYENLKRDWPWPLTVENMGKYRPVHWCEAPIDWDRWAPLYAEDEKLWRALN